MPLLCVTLKNHETTVRLPAEIAAQDAVLRMVAYDQHRNAVTVTHFPSWEVDISELLGSSNEIKNSSGLMHAGSTRLSLPNCHFSLSSNTTGAGFSNSAVIYPNIKFHLGHIGTDGCKLRVYHEPSSDDGTPTLDKFWSQPDKDSGKTDHKSHDPDWYFREIKLYFEYLTNDHGPSTA